MSVWDPVTLNVATFMFCWFVIEAAYYITVATMRNQARSVLRDSLPEEPHVKEARREVESWFGRVTR